MSISTISPQRLYQASQSGEPIKLIDVRTPVEFREVHLDFAMNRPLDRLDPAGLLPEHDQNQPLYVICRSGGRAQQACERLSAAGFTNVVNVEGGTTAWDQAGLPVVRGQKSISLDRQVRIAAGSMVVLGSLLGAFVHPYWIGLSAFVGSGLIFAGVTDTCGLAMILGRMPWNQLKTPSGDTSARSSPKSCCRS